jgi:four helix bundle protein
MNQTPVDLKVRTKAFALRILRLGSSLPKSGPAGVIARQIFRCGSSIGAQYREAHRARSTAEFISKLESATQELDETMYGMELLRDGGFMKAEKLSLLMKEADELMAIFVTSVRTAKNSKRR